MCAHHLRGKMGNKEFMYLVYTNPVPGHTPCHTLLFVCHPQNCDLLASDLQHANLRGANLEGAVLKEVVI